MKNNLKFRQFVPTQSMPQGEFMYWGFGVEPGEAVFTTPTAVNGFIADSEQWTGEIDMNGHKIYVGDYVMQDNTIGEFPARFEPYEVKMIGGGFHLVHPRDHLKRELLAIGESFHRKIVGNIHESKS